MSHPTTSFSGRRFFAQPHVCLPLSMLVLWMLPAPAGAREMDDDVVLGCISDEATIDKPCGSSQLGVLRWLWEVRRRTSVAIRPVPVQASFAAEPPPQPLLLWTAGNHAAPLSPATRRHLNQFLRSGGTLLVDASDAAATSRFVSSVRTTLQQLFGMDALAPVPRDHVLYKSFYLVSEVAGRSTQGVAAEGLQLGGRLAAILLHHDLFGSLVPPASQAADEMAVDARGERGQEMDLRWAINWLLYALCGDYKNDHVHLPFILKRRQ